MPSHSPSDDDASLDNSSHDRPSENKTSANKSSTNPPNDDFNSLEFEQNLRELEQSVLRLKARYAQVQIDQQRQQELKIRQNQIEHQLPQTRSRAVRAELNRELKRLKQQLEELEVALESQLFSWSGMKEVFWQAVRFGGLGIVLGWILRSVVG